MAMSAQEALKMWGSNSPESSDESVSIADGVDIGNKGGRTRDYLKIDDIVNDPEKVEKVRRYMVTTKGKQYAERPAEEMVDEWVEHMRYFNTNEVSTVKEAMRVSKMSDREKDATADAYNLYDELGYFWQNDGIAGTVDGLWDYMKAVATSPSTYVGFGVAKGLGFGAQKMGVAAVRRKAMRDAVRNKTQGASTKEIVRDMAKRNAKKDAWSVALTTGAIDGGIAAYQDKTQQGAELEAGSREEYNPWQTLISSAMQGGLSTLVTRLAPEASLKAGISGQARQMRSVRHKRMTIKEGVDRDNAFEKAGEQLAKNYKDFREGALKGREMRKLQPDEWRSRYPDDVRRRDLPEGTPEIPTMKERNAAVKAEESGRPIRAYETPLPKEVIKEILNTVRKIDFDELGINFAPNINDSEKFAILVQNLNPKKLEEFRDMIWGETGLWLGDIADRIQLGRNIGNQLRFSASEVGTTLQMFNDSSTRRIIDEALAEGEQVAGRHAQALLESRLENKSSFMWYKEVDTNPGQRLSYLQNIWKRLLVSTPQTTAINVLGWGQLQIGNTLAELVQAAQLAVLGGGQFAVGSKGYAQSLQQAKALGSLQFEKLRRLVDPYSTREMYMEALNANPALKEKLYNTTMGGVIANADRFEFEKAGKVFRGTEAFVKMSQDISMVRLQDQLTKSQSFINALDKHLRLDKGMSLSEALQKGDLRALDEDIMSKAGADTLESVFSKDYRAKAKIGDKNAGQYFLGPVGKTVAGIAEAPGNIGQHMATAIEAISNNSMLGYYLPFGRFMNNVVATSYRWTLGGALNGTAAVMKGEKISATEGFARATVGITAIKVFTDMDKEKEKRGLAWNEIQFNDGSIIDGTNTFPMSLLMVMGRISNRVSSGQSVSSELYEDFTKQMAIGQAAKDLQFGNDIAKLGQALNFTAYADRGEGERVVWSVFENWKRQGDWAKSLGQGLADSGVGNVIAGFSRPIDPLNRVVGVATGTDLMVDRRLPKSGWSRFGMQSGRYVDNIFEALSGEVYGESLQKASRPEEELRDPSAISGMAGFKELPPKTYGEMVFAMVDLPNWKTNMYTGVPEHDRFVDKVITPAIEEKAQLLLKNKRFINSKNLDWKRDQVDKMLKSAKASVTDFFFKGDPSGEGGLAYRKKKLDRTPHKYMKTARKMTGIQTSIRELNEAEIERLENTITMIRQEPSIMED